MYDIYWHRSKGLMYITQYMGHCLWDYFVAFLRFTSHNIMSFFIHFSTDSCPIHTAVCMRGSCTSPPPPLCESYRCGEGWNFSLASATHFNCHSVQCLLLCLVLLYLRLPLFLLLFESQMYSRYEQESISQ